MKIKILSSNNSASYYPAYKNVMLQIRECMQICQVDLIEKYFKMHCLCESLFSYVQLWLAIWLHQGMLQMFNVIRVVMETDLLSSSWEMLFRPVRWVTVTWHSSNEKSGNNFTNEFYSQIMPDKKDFIKTKTLKTWICFTLYLHWEFVRQQQHKLIPISI